MEEKIKRPVYTPEELNSNIAYGMTGVNNINKEELESIQWLCEKSMNDDIKIKELEEKLAKFEKFCSHSNITTDMFLKAVTDNFYYIDKDWLDIFWTGNRWVYIGNGWSDHFIQTRPHHCEDCSDAHIFDWKKDKSVNFKDYGKTWALTKEELEDELEMFKLELIKNAVVKYEIASVKLCIINNNNKYLAVKDYTMEGKRIIKCLNVCKSEEDCIKVLDNIVSYYKK